MDGGHVEVVEDGVGVLEGGGVGVEGAVDDGQKALVEGLALLAGRQVLARREVVVGGHDGVVAAAAALQPGVVLGLFAGEDGVHGVDRDVLVSAERGGDEALVPEVLGGEVAGRRVETLQEGLGRALENIVDGGGDGQLRQCGRVTAQAQDGRRSIRSNVTVAIVVARGKDLFPSQRRQVRGREDLGCPIAVSGEDVDAEHGLGLDERQGCQRQQAGVQQTHCVVDIEYVVHTTYLDALYLLRHCTRLIDGASR